MPPGRVGHAKKHDVGDARVHKGDIYDGLMGSTNPITAANYVVELKKLNDTIAGIVAGLHWQPNIIRFEAMVTNEPALPSDGDRFISTEAGNIPSTAQAVLIGDVCEWDNGTSLWVIETPDDGWVVVEDGCDPNKLWMYSGTAWNNLSSLLNHAGLLNLDYASSGHTGFEPAFAKNTGFNLDIGKVAGTVLEGDSIDQAHATNIFHVDQTRGSDTNDGGPFSMFATLQHALNQIGEGEHRVIIVYDDELAAFEDITLSDASTWKSAVIFCHSATFNWYFKIRKLTMGNNWSIQLNSLDVRDILETAGCTWSEVWCENVSISTAIPNLNAPNTDLYSLGMRISKVAWDAAIFLSKVGWYFDVISNRLVSSDGMSAGGTIQDVTDPTLAQDAATKNYVDNQVAGKDEFIELTDTPAAYVIGDVGKPVVVNPTHNGLAFETEGTAFNKAYGSGAGTTCEGDRPVLLAGRSGGQIVFGGDATGNDLELKANSLDANIARMILKDTGDFDIGYGKTIFTYLIRYDRAANIVSIRTKLSLANHLISDILDPVSPQDADTQNARDSAISTHAGLPSVHHTKYTDAEARTAVQYRVDVSLAGVAPVDADVATWNAGDRGQGIGTGGREFYMVKRGTAVKYTELS